MSDLLCVQDTWAKGYWVLDMNVQCFKGWHLTLTLTLGLVTALLFCCGIPVFTLVMLCKRRKVLDDDETKEHFGFLYRAYDFR